MSTDISASDSNEEKKAAAWAAWLAIGAGLINAILGWATKTPFQLVSRRWQMRAAAMPTKARKCSDFRS
ncbi:hypothetical protein [Streptomyces sp. NPDC040750]|uniref:hypothetical protein n=1 Tax=Streptomyces sp. NPDC040750 TaxID=3154491 RepID=UPI0033FD4C22